MLRIAWRPRSGNPFEKRRRALGPRPRHSISPLCIPCKRATSDTAETNPRGGLPCFRYTAPLRISNRYTEQNRSSMGRSVSSIMAILKGRLSVRTRKNTSHGLLSQLIIYSAAH